MAPTRIAALLSLLAAILVGGTAFLAFEQLDVWQIPLYVAAMLAVGATMCLGVAGIRSGGIRFLRSSGDSNRTVDGESEAAYLPRGELATLLDQRLQQVEQREQDLANRLMAYQQWLEFPPPVDLAENQPPTVEMLDRDRQLGDLLEEQAKQLFDKIRGNAYSPDGTFQAKLVRDDVHELVDQIACIYGREPGHPLSGVSVERILRAASRCCLNFLGELEKLPLDVHSYDLAGIYAHIRQAVKVYGLYRSAGPYLRPLQGAYYATRVVMGVNPLALGAWWFAGSLSRKGAKVLATKVANRWALSFLHDIVRVIGYEVAGVYDERFRYRDPNWWYAAELTELLRQFPSSEQALRHALSQIGALQLRNEYDRIFFFRCITEGKTAGMGRVQVSDFPPDQRKEIVQRLESFLETHIVSRPEKTVRQWQAGVEERLAIRLDLEETVDSRSEDEQRYEAVHSLAGYLLEIKQSELDSLQPLLSGTSSAQSLSEARQAEMWQSLREDPPFFYEMRQLRPGGDVAEEFLADLVSLAVGVSPRYASADEIVLSTAVHLRSDAARTQTALDRSYVEEVARRLPEDAPRRKLPAQVARAVLDLVQEEETLFFVYDNVTLLGRERTDAWLVGVADRLVCFAMEETPQLLWEGDRATRLDHAKGFKGGCRISGGRWLIGSESSTPSLLIRTSVLKNKGKYFASLAQFVER